VHTSNVFPLAPNNYRFVFRICGRNSCVLGKYVLYVSTFLFMHVQQYFVLKSPYLSQYQLEFLLD